MNLDLSLDLVQVRIGRLEEEAWLYARKLSYFGGQRLTFLVDTLFVGTETSPTRTLHKGSIHCRGSTQTAFCRGLKLGNRDRARHPLHCKKHKTNVWKQWLFVVQRVAKTARKAYRRAFLAHKTLDYRRKAGVAAHYAYVRLKSALVTLCAWLCLEHRLSLVWYPVDRSWVWFFLFDSAVGSYVDDLR